jgi:hypothetical protein
MSFNHQSVTDAGSSNLIRVPVPMSEAFQEFVIRKEKEIGRRERRTVLLTSCLTCLD